MASAASNLVLQGQLSGISFLRRFLLRSRATNPLRWMKSSLTRANHIVPRAARAPSAPLTAARMVASVNGLAITSWISASRRWALRPLWMAAGGVGGGGGLDVRATGLGK